MSVGESYMYAVKQAGGLPVILPSALAGEDLQAPFDRLDGILFHRQQLLQLEDVLDDLLTDGVEVHAVAVDLGDP